MSDPFNDLERRLVPFVMSKRTAVNLAPVHPLLKKVVYEGLHYVDFTVTTGFRNKAAQEEAFNLGRSKAHFGQSPHNYQPALAFDAYLNPIDVNSVVNTQVLAHALKIAAQNVGVNLEWGGDWKRFKDRPHFQLRGWGSYR